MNYQEGADKDDEYFKCYADMSIHLEMLNDEVRTNTYRYAILKNYNLFYKKIILDVGAGTGILSLFCVQAGAKKVYAVEASDMAFEAKRVVEDNGVSNRVQVIHGKIEDIEIPEKVDVIISEWMGYCLFYESMLCSVLLARDKFLKQGGTMFPHLATLYMVPIADDDVIIDGSDVWEKAKNLYKVDITSLKERAINNFVGKIHINAVNPQNIVSFPAVIAKLDLTQVSLSSLSPCYCESKFTFKSFGMATVNGFCTYFDVSFHNDITLSTSPYKQQTHWQQSVMYLKRPIQVGQDDVISGRIFISSDNLDKRSLKVLLEYDVVSFTSNILPQKILVDSTFDSKRTNEDDPLTQNITTRTSDDDDLMSTTTPEIVTKVVVTTNNNNYIAPQSNNNNKYIQHFLLNQFC